MDQFRELFVLVNKSMNIALQLSYQQLCHSGLWSLVPQTPKERPH